MKISNWTYSTYLEIMGNVETLKDKGIEIEDFMVLQNPVIPETLFVKYNFTLMEGGQKKIINMFIQIDKNGIAMDIGDQFENIYQRYAFLGDCLPVLPNDIIVE